MTGTAHFSAPLRIRWTRTQAKRMLDANILMPHQYELIRGDFIAKMPQNQPRAASNDNGYDALTDVFGRGYVQHSTPIVIDETTEPEPDLAVLCQHRRNYTDNPAASECVLVVEVSDSTLAIDRTTKAELYAKAGIPEYWIVNVNVRTLIVHRQPAEDGYGNIQTYDETQSVAPLEKPNKTVAVADLLP